MKPLEPPYTITPTTLEDASDILPYLKIIGGESHSLSFGKEGLSITIQQEQQHIQEIIDHPINCEWKVVMKDEIVGLASISAYPKKRMAHRAEISLSVRKSHWHMGIGRALLETIINYAKTKDELNLLWLEVIEDNTRAISMYEAYGFTKVGYAKRYTRVDGIYYGAYLMDLDIERRKQP